MSVNKALDSILAGKLDEMRTNFSNALSTKAVEKLEERKIDIAKNYFGQMQEEVEELDEVLDTVQRAEKHIIKHNNSEASATLSGDKNTLRKRKRGEKSLMKLRDRNQGKWVKNALKGVEE